MSKGLKQMVEEALADQPAPVEVSNEAHLALSRRVREWSGWNNAVLVFGNPGAISPFASTDHVTRQVTANVDRLLLNPNRVLLTLTPFRERQEAVLTGALLHETAGHARHSHWQPGRYGNPVKLLHSDGQPAAKATVALARLLEEPRIEGLVARDADEVGATGLEWTLRAAMAKLAPLTELAVDPNQKVMDLLTGWVLRAGKQIAMGHRLRNYSPRPWVGDFTNLLHSVIVDHLSQYEEDQGAVASDAHKIMTLLLEMILCDDDTGPTMIDKARDVLALLFPETPPEEQPTPQEVCAGQADAQPQESEEDESESDDATSSSDDEEDESDEGDEGDESDESDDEADESESDESESDESESDDEGEGEGEGEGEEETDTESDLAKRLREIEEQADEDTEQQADIDKTGSGAGSGTSSHLGGGFRSPTAEEREVQKGAEKFLRHLIAPTESSTVSLTDQPSTLVDGAALAAWKAGGQTRAPHFFVRTRRQVEPSPPVRIAVLVDVSGSMDELAKPSALLSWALASAAIDLKNFAGRGVNIESTLIHWGDRARVIQKNGDPLPGIRQHECREGTDALPGAMALVEEQIPGFYDMTDKPVNRLIVQFTDWNLTGGGYMAGEYVSRALAAGVNMLSVVPARYSVRSSNLPGILKNAPVQRGSTSLLKFNPMFPEQVWESAAEALA